MKRSKVKRSIAVWIVSFIAIIFGIMTVKSAGLVIFGPEEYAREAGNYIPFVVWFNFIAGFFYIIAGVYLFLQNKRGVRLAMIIALITLIAFAALGIYILNGGAFEMRTIIAMTVRSLVWIGIAIFSLKKLTP